MTGYHDESYSAAGGGPRINAMRLWVGGLATALVAALIGLVGVLVVRAIFRIALYAPRDAGALGDADTLTLCVLSAVAALAATGLAHLLLLGAPRPLAYFGWIVGLLTTAAVVMPFLAGGSLPVTCPGRHPPGHRAGDRQPRLGLSGERHAEDDATAAVRDRGGTRAPTRTRPAPAAPSGIVR